MEVIDRKVSELIPYANNPRHNDGAVDAVAASIKNFGFRVPIIVDKDGVIVAGHTRLKAAQKLGLKTVPCIVADDLTPEQVKAFRLADNKVGELAGWDFEKLDLELEELDFDMTPFGFEFDAEEDDTERKSREDTVPEAPKAPVTRLGDVWLLGEHRVMCGDSTDADEAVEKLMNGRKAEFAFYSPPYNVGESSALSPHAGDNNKYIGYKDDNKDYEGLLLKSTEAALKNCKYCAVNIQMLSGNKLSFVSWLNANKLNLCDIAIWYKDNAQPAMASRVMNSSFEFVVLLSKENNSRAFGTNNFRGTVSNVYQSHVQNSNEYSGIHSATFPVAFAEHFINSFSNKGELVLDLFGGTGTTLIAAQRTGRLCYMMELSPSYVDVIIERWQKETGDQAILERTGEAFDSLKA